MKVIAFAAQKGGTGKTTLSGHVAVEAERKGAGPVALIDTDPQGSLATWWNARSLDTPAFVRTSIATLGEDIEQLRAAGIQLVVIDTPPAMTWAIRDVVSISDLVVVPVRPSPHDLAAAGVTVDLVENLNKPLMFVVNCASKRARITSEAAIALSQHGTVAPTVIGNRTDFASSMIDGRTVMELPKSLLSTKEIDSLWAYIAERLARIASDEQVPPTIPLNRFGMPRSREERAAL
jgi:chromosome partitioning protein